MANATFAHCLPQTREIFVLELIANVAAVVSLSGLPREKRGILFSGNNAASGVLIKAPSGVPVILAPVESFRRPDARPLGSCWVERVPSGANAADAPSRGRTPCVQRQMTWSSAPLQQGFQQPGDGDTRCGTSVLKRGRVNREYAFCA